MKYRIYRSSAVWSITLAPCLIWREILDLPPDFVVRFVKTLLWASSFSKCLLQVSSKKPNRLKSWSSMDYVVRNVELCFISVLAHTPGIAKRTRMKFRPSFYILLFRKVTL